MGVLSNLNQWVTKNYTALKQVTKNLCEFVDAACLAGVAGYSITEALKHNSGFWYKALLFSGLVIALQAFVLLVRHFNYER